MAERASTPKTIGRYALGQPIAAGGMGTLHLGRLVGSAGFARMVAIKRLHPHLCLDPAFVEMFADEARLAARVRHPNVVPTLDVVKGDGELLLVMEYVDGDSLSTLAAARGSEEPSAGRQERVPLPVVVAIVSEMLHGLHAAHEAKGEDGEPLGIVHRDVSPQNVLVGADGVARLVDFGIARATNRAGTTGPDDLKGKLAYMAPEQIRREAVTRKADIFAAGVVLWELLTGTRLFAADDAGATLEKILVGWVAPPSSVVRDLPEELDAIALRALDPDPGNRFATAREMAVALEDALGRALTRTVAEWVESRAAPKLAHRRALVAAAERGHVQAPSSAELASSIASIEHAPTVTAFTIDDRHVRESSETPAGLAISVHAPDSEWTLPLGPSSSTPVLDHSSWHPRGTAKAEKTRKAAKVEKAAAFLFGLVALVMVFVGARSTLGGRGEAHAAGVQGTPPARQELPPAVEARGARGAEHPEGIGGHGGPKPPEDEALPAVSPPQDVVVPRAAVAPAGPVATPAATNRGAHKPWRSRVSPRTPCVAKVDPATQKKIYQGDCD